MSNTFGPIKGPGVTVTPQLPLHAPHPLGIVLSRTEANVGAAFPLAQGRTTRGPQE